MHIKNDSLTLASFILSILAISVASCNVRFADTSTDTFIGIMAGFIGICATIMVGFQIFNSIDTRRKLREIEGIQEDLKKELLEVKKEREIQEIKSEIYLHHLKALSLHEVQPFTAVLGFTQALELSLSINDVTLTTKQLHYITVTITKIEERVKKEKFSTKDYNNLMSFNYKKINSSPLYSLIENEIDRIKARVLNIKLPK